MKKGYGTATFVEKARRHAQYYEFTGEYSRVSRRKGPMQTAHAGK